MKNSKLLLIGILLTSFTLHKFYVGMFHIEYLENKKELRITTRVFIDDINAALEKKFNQKTSIGEVTESEQDVALLQKYFTEKFQLTVNNVSKKYIFLSKEIDNNVVVCYLKIKEVPKIKTLKVENSILVELYPEQQNIIQFTNNGEKSSLLLTEENTSGMLKK